jgi:hypothetical protein
LEFAKSFLIIRTLREGTAVIYVSLTPLWMRGIFKVADQEVDSFLVKRWLKMVKSKLSPSSLVNAIVGDTLGGVIFSMETHT